MQRAHPQVRPLEPIQLPSDSGDPQDVRFFLRDNARLSDDQLVVTLPALCLIELSDGSRSSTEVLEEFHRLTGVRLGQALLEDLMERLDGSFLLDNERARGRLNSIEPRPPIHCGGGYPEEPEELQRFLQHLLQGETEAPSQSLPRASILPHIDFFRGERSYRAGYRELAAGLSEGDEPLTVVILGISHALSRTPFILTRKDFATPLGLVETDRDLVEQLASGLPFDPFQDEYNHLGEHSVEFHAVLLRHLVPCRRPLKIVPILCSSFLPAIQGRFSPLELNGVPEFITKLRELKTGLDTRLHYLASVDLAHLGTQFDTEPMNPEKLSQLEARDRASLEAVARGDGHAFFATHQEDGGDRNYCGTPAIFTLLELFPEPFLLHHYQQCTDPDQESTVTVCSMTLP